MKNRKPLVIVMIISLLTAILAYPFLPDQIPIHWDINGTADQLGQKYYIFFPILMQILVIFGFSFFRKIDPRKSNYVRFSSVYSTLTLTISLFIYAMELMTLLVVYQPTLLSVPALITIGLGILFIVLGNKMPQIKQNYFIGIKTPWALHDENNWQKTHRFSGKLWFFIGFIFFPIAFLPTKIHVMILFFIVLLMALIPYLYSYLLYRKTSKGDSK